MSRSASAAVEETALPTVFDRLTVQRLIDTIEQAHNSSILKGAYFAAHADEALPQAEGYKLLQAALQKEPVDSKRWFYLQSTAAFGALRVGPSSRKEGLRYYDSLFDHAPEAINSNEYYPLQRSVYEYVFTMPTALVLNSPADVNLADALLFKSFNTYLLLLRAKQPGAFEPDWEQVAPFTVTDSRYASEAETALSDPAMPKSYQLYRAAAAMMKYSDPKRTLASLQQAKAALHTSDRDELGALYGLLVDASIRTGDWKLAIATQRELIQRVGVGRARLAILFLHSKNEKAFIELLSELQRPAANEEDVVETATLLLKRGRTDPVRGRREWAVAQSLLKTYLSAQRVRSSDTELVARLTLAQSYQDQNRLKEAQIALDISELKPTFTTPDSVFLYQEALQMKNDVVQAIKSQSKPASAGSARKSTTKPVSSLTVK